MTVEQSTNINVGANTQGFVSGMQAASDAAQKFEAAVGQMATAVSQTSERVTVTASQFARFQQNLDPAARAATQFAKAQDMVQRSLAAGLTNQDQANKLLDLAAAKYKTVEYQAQQAGKAQAEAATRTAQQQAEAATRIAQQQAEATTRTAQQQASAFKNLEASLDPAAAKQQQMAGIQKTLNEAVTSGASSQDRANQLLAVAKNRYNDTGEAVKLQAYQVGNLVSQFRQFGVQVASGQGFFTPFIQQAPQAIYSVGGLSNALALLRGNLATMAVGGGIVAVVAALALMASSAERNQRALNALSAGLQPLRNDYTATAAVINTAAKQLAESTTLGTQEARDALLKLAQDVPGLKITTQNLTNLGKVAQDLGAGNVTQGVEKLIGVLNNPAAAAYDALQRHVKDVDTTFVTHIQTLVNLGSKSEAAAEVMNRLAAASAGVGDPATRLQKAWHDLIEEFTKTGNAAGGASNGIGVSITNALATAIDGATKLLELLGKLRDLADHPVGGYSALDAMRQGLAPMLPFGALSLLPSKSASLPIGDTSGLGTLSPEQTTALKAAISGRESASLSTINPFGYVGQYQMGRDALAQTGFVRPGVGFQSNPNSWEWTGKAGADSLDAFQHSAPAQNEAMNALLQANLKELTAKGAITAQSTPEQIGGLLASAHLAGAQGAMDLLKQTDHADAFGTRASTYYEVGAAALRGTPSPSSPSLVSPLEDDKSPALQILRAQDAASSFRQTGALGELTSGGSLEQQKQAIQELISGTQKLHDVNGLNAADQESLSAKVLKLTAAYNALETPAETAIRQLRDQNKAAEVLDPAEREVTQRVIELNEANRAAGRETSDIERNQIRVQVLKEMSSQFAQSYDVAQKQTQWQEALTSAYGDNVIAGQHMTNMLRAYFEIGSKFPENSAAQKQAVAALAAEYDKYTEAVKKLQVIQELRQGQGQIDLLTVQRRTIGQSTMAQETALAQAQAEISAKQQGYSPADTAKLVAQARQHAALTVDVDREKQAWATVDNAASTALDDIGTGLETALATGKWTDFASVAKQALGEISKAFLQLALINPLKNLLGVGGSNAPSISSLFAVGSNLFGGGSTGIVGANADVLSGVTADAIAANSALFHDGGIVGDSPTARSRSTPAWVFAHAPRLHSGGWLPPNFANDEVPAILQKGEMVLTAAQQRKLNTSQRPMVVNHTINISTPNADSFRRSQPQIQTDMARTLARASRRM